jgi:hypothetical protein
MALPKLNSKIAFMRSRTTCGNSGILIVLSRFLRVVRIASCSVKADVCVPLLNARIIASASGRVILSPRLLRQ